MPPLVTIRPRILPQAHGPDPEGVVRAAELLYGHSERRRAEQIRAQELEAARQHDVSMAELRGDIGSRQIGERGEVESGLLGQRGAQELEQIGARGVESRATDEAAFELRRPFMERELDQGDVRLGLQRRGQNLDYDVSLLSLFQRANEEEGRNTRFNVGQRGSSGSEFPLQSFGRDIAEDYLTNPQTGEVDYSRLGEVMEIMRGRVPAGAAAGGRMTVPPGLTRNEQGTPISYGSPSGDFQLDSAQIAQIRNQPPESHVEALRALPDPDSRAEYLSLLEPRIAQYLQRLVTQSGGGM